MKLKPECTIRYIDVCRIQDNLIILHYAALDEVCVSKDDIYLVWNVIGCIDNDLDDFLHIYLC